MLAPTMGEAFDEASNLRIFSADSAESFPALTASSAACLKSELIGSFY
jgi:hypothetical protein